MEEDLLRLTSPIPPPQIPLSADAFLDEALDHYMDNPNDWIRDIIEKEPDEWQAEAFDELLKFHYVSVRSGHGVGKTTLLAWIISYFLSTRFRVKIVCTANTDEQLHDILWAECKDWIDASKSLSSTLKWTETGIYAIDRPTQAFATPRTAKVKKKKDMGSPTQAVSMQGYHSDTVVLILDEASGIDDAVVQALLGALTGEDVYVIMTGNPTTTSGYFYDSHHSKAHMWKTFHINSEQSARVSKAWLARMLEEYNNDREHPLYRIKVRGEFPVAQPNALYPLHLLRNAQKLPREPGRVHTLGVDPARYGSNNTVICYADENGVEKWEIHRHIDTMETADKVVSAAQRWNPASIRIDVVGVGGGVFDRLKQLGFKNLVPISNGSQAKDKKNFVNFRCESHWGFRQKLETGRFYLPKSYEGEILIAEASPIVYTVTPNEKISVQTKDELLELGLKSPDVLDSAVMATCDVAVMAQKPPFRTRFGSIPFMGR